MGPDVPGDGPRRGQPGRLGGGGREDSGALRVRLQGDPRTEVTLPADYVGQHVTLGYASTSHAAQGRTVDTGHALVDVAMSRHELYPNLTRGRERNTAYVTTAAEPADDNGYQALDSDRIAVLAEVLDRDTGQRAALQVMREELEAAESLPRWARSGRRCCGCRRRGGGAPRDPA